MSNRTSQSLDQYRSLIYSIFFFAIAQGVITLVLIYTAFRTEIPSLGLSGFVTFCITLASCISAILLLRGNVKLGVWIFILAIAIGVPLITFGVTGLGWFGLLVIPLIITWIASQALDSKGLRWAIAIGIISAAINLLVDLYGPLNRPSIPFENIIFPMIIVIMAGIAGFILALRFNSLTLQTKVLILFLLISLIPIGILTYLNYNSTKNILTNTANLALFSSGTQTSNQIDTFFESTKSIIQAEAQLTVIRDFLTGMEYEDSLSSKDAEVALSIFQSKDPDHILSYSLINTSGEVMLRYPATSLPHLPFLGVNIAVENSMRTTLLDRQQYASPVLFLDNEQPSIFFATAVYDSNDDINPVGLLVIEYDAFILQELMEEQNELAGTDSFGVLFDNYQIHLAHGIDPSTLYKTVGHLDPQQIEALIEADRLPDLPLEQLSTNLQDLSTKLNNTREAPFFSAIDVATGDRLNQVAVAKINAQPWQVGFFQPQDVYLRIINQQTRNAFLFLAFIAVIVTALSFAATRLISTPILHLTELVEHVAAGSLAIQVPILTQDEIGRLAVAFNALTTQIRNLLSGLEDQVAERTKALERQTIQLQTAAEVARDASNLQDIEELLDRTVNLIHDRFGFYHAGIFLLDEREENAILRAANSVGGKEMLRRGHRLKVGQTGIVGLVTSKGEPRIALDVDSDAAHFSHTLLPRTRSEIALPLIVTGRIIGALDVQSTEANAFDEGDISVLQVLSDLLAVAIENTRLLSEVRQSVIDLQTVYGEFTQESWQRWAQHENRPTGFRYRGAGIEPTIDKSPEAILALKHNKLITRPNDDRSINQFRVAIPIRLRDHTFGVINLQIEGDEAPPDLIVLIENISNRLATALENARLYEETQRRAAQEQVTSEIASRIRESLDIDSVLKTTVQEIGQKLNLHDVSVQIDFNGISSHERES